MPTAIVAGVSSASILTGVLLSGVDNVATTQSVLVGAGMAGLYLGGPIVHWSNGQIQRGFAVLGLHTGFGLLGGFIGMASCSDDCAGGDLLGLKRAGLFSFGAILGTVVSNAIDIGVFTYKDRNPTIVTGRQRFPFTMSPQLMMGRDSGGIGLAGTF